MNPLRRILRCDSAKLDEGTFPPFTSHHNCGRIAQRADPEVLSLTLFPFFIPCSIYFQNELLVTVIQDPSCVMSKTLMPCIKVLCSYYHVVFPYCSISMEREGYFKQRAFLHTFLIVSGHTECNTSPSTSIFVLVANNMLFSLSIRLRLGCSEDIFQTAVI